MFDYRIDIKIYGDYMKMKKARWQRAQLKDSNLIIPQKENLMNGR